MSKLKLIDTVNMPTWAIVYFEYGDNSGLTEDDIKTADDWLQGYIDEYGPITFSYDGYTRGFESRPAFGLPCECEDCKLLYWVKS